MKLEEMVGKIGTDIGTSDWYLLDQARIDHFAETTEDRQFIHVNPVAILVTAVRDLMAGTATLGTIGLSLLGPAIITVICAPVAMALYARRR